MLKRMVATQDRVTLDGAYDANGNPIEISIECLFNGTRLAELGFNAPSSVRINHTRPEAEPLDRLPSVAGYSLGDLVLVAGKTYRLVTEVGATGTKRVWLALK